jgi:hypothetical protein
MILNYSLSLDLFLKFKYDSGSLEPKYTAGSLEREYQSGPLESQ